MGGEAESGGEAGEGGHARHEVHRTTGSCEGRGQARIQASDGMGEVKKRKLKSEESSNSVNDTVLISKLL